MCHHFSFEIRSSKNVFLLLLLLCCHFHFFSFYLCSCFVRQYYCFIASNIRQTDKHGEQKRQRLLWFRTVSTTSNNMRSRVCAQRTHTHIHRVSKIYDNFLIFAAFLNVIVSQILLPESCPGPNRRISTHKFIVFGAQKLNMRSARCQSALRLNDDTAPILTTNGC